MKILYKDNDIIVCEKDYGVSSQESSGANMLDLIRRECSLEAFVVHRLDVTTRGVMVYALNRESASNLCTQVATKAFEKEYLAIAHSKTPNECEMVDFLYHDRYQNKSFIAKSKRAGAKEARLELFTLGAVNHADFGELSLVKIKLHTGRTHQIRVQLSSRAHPLYGDGKYGAKDNDKIALYSHSISFFHPKTKKKMHFRSYPEAEGAWCLFKDSLA